MFAWRHILLICVFLIYLCRSEKPLSTYPNLNIYPNDSIIYKPNSNHSIMCIGDSRFNYVIYLYQIKNDKLYVRAKTRSNVLKVELHLNEGDNGTSLQCYIEWKYHTKATKPIDLLLNRTSDAKSAHNERNAVSVVLLQVTLANAESYWKHDGLVTITIVVMLLIIIILKVIRTKWSKPQGFLCSDSISSHSDNFKNHIKKYTRFRTCDGYERITDKHEVMEI